MIFEIIFSLKAEETYEAVVTQLRERWGDRFVKKFEAKLDVCFKNLTATPYMYPTGEENLEQRKCALHKNCSMFYRVSNDKVLIDYFWDNRQEPLF